ncbi:hypothetical protein PT974_10059 [Cladobotryum mycophilum]|uniref:Integral membrane protein n=1 Tax=Cladobotryum mycophilum TaxID=491253 RepID=A0ABR0S9V9_9HYPO
MAQVPITTIVPFNDRAQLPACAVSCGHLYDANGACVPPAVPQQQPQGYTDCFCADPRLAPFSTATAGVCDNACTAEPNGLSSITAWYHSLCKINTAPAGGKLSTSSVAPGTTGTPPPSQTQGPSGDWISNHWQWVIMLVVLVVGIAGIWIGACIWRRRYVRKRDLHKAANTAARTSWGPDPNESTAGIPMTYTGKGDASTPTLPTFVSTAEKRKSHGKKWFGS